MFLAATVENGGKGTNLRYGTHTILLVTFNPPSKNPTKISS